MSRAEVEEEMVTKSQKKVWKAKRRLIMGNTGGGMCSPITVPYPAMGINCQELLTHHKTMSTDPS